MSIQAYCFNNKVYYQEYKPNHSLYQLFYELKSDVSNQILAIPDACLDFHFFCDEKTPSAYICGTALEGRLLKKDMTTNCFGVRLKAGVVTDCFREFIQIITNENIPLENYIKIDHIMEEMVQNKNFKDRIGIFLKYFHPFLTVSLHPITNHILQKIDGLNGCINVAQLANDTGYSHRYIDRIFKQDTGLTVKSYAKIVRFQRVFDSMKKDQTLNIDKIMEWLNFYDQSHFVKEFKFYTSYSPKDFVEKYVK